MVILVDVQVDSRTIVSFNPQSYQGQEEKILRERFPSVLRDEIELLNQLKSMSNEIRFLVSKGENGSHNIALRVCGEDFPIIGKPNHRLGESLMEAIQYIKAGMPRLMSHVKK
jgi:hypothetical protein